MKRLLLAILTLSMLSISDSDWCGQCYAGHVYPEKRDLSNGNPQNPASYCEYADGILNVYNKEMLESIKVEIKYNGVVVLTDMLVLPITSVQYDFSDCEEGLYVVYISSGKELLAVYSFYNII